MTTRSQTQSSAYFGAPIYSKPPKDLLYLCELALAEVELFNSSGQANTRVLAGSGLLDKYVGKVPATGSRSRSCNAGFPPDAAYF